ncbi:MAG TPA: serine--tRNA ligase [Elusimicrobiota bacterium]|jgi:seryl-tRNA synthetase|nr:serine--tRNA ligase [Elusimicrobiota bacterium]
MIDPALIRKAPEAVRAGLKNRGGAALPALEEWLRLDIKHREILKAVEDSRAKINALSKDIGKAKAAKDEARAAALMTEVAKAKAEAGGVDAQEAEKVFAALRRAALEMPNLPHESVPLGKSEADNPVVRAGRAPVQFDFKPLDHQALGEKLGLLDFAAAAKLSGARFSLWRGAGARLMRAITAFLLDLHAKAGYEEILPPYLVLPEVMEGTGQLPKFESDLYKTTEDGGEQSRPLYLIPTAEVPLTNLVRGEILPPEKLPLKMTAYTPCFRQEAGSYGKDVRGLIRNHQFDKVELVWITRPEESLAALERLTADAEAALTSLEIPHRVIHLCTGDMGFSSRKTYDLEVWMPSESRYREISSCSDCGDFQARRMNARFRPAPQAAPQFVHTLNGSGVAVGRLFAAILENFQDKDGRVRIPKALVPFFGADVLS